MRCNCAMMFSRVTSPEEEEGVDVDGAERDGVEWEGGATEFVCQDRNYTLLHLMVA